MPYRTEISLSSLPLRVIGPAALEELSITAQIRTVVDLLVQYEIVKGYAPFVGTGASRKNSRNAPSHETFLRGLLTGAW
jgi:hypothetical protein